MPARRAPRRHVAHEDWRELRSVLSWLVLGGWHCDTIAEALGWHESRVRLLMFAPGADALAAVLAGTDLTVERCRRQLLGLFDRPVEGELPMARLARVAVQPPKWLLEATA